MSIPVWMSMLKDQINEWLSELEQGYGATDKTWSECYDWMEENPKVLAWGPLPFSSPLGRNWNDVETEGFELQKTYLESITEAMPLIMNPDNLLWTFEIGGSGFSYRHNKLTISWCDPKNPENHFQMVVGNLMDYLSGDLKLPDFSNVYRFFDQMRDVQIKRGYDEWQDWLDSSGDFWPTPSHLFRTTHQNIWNESETIETNKEESLRTIWIVTPMIINLPDMLNWSSEQFQQLWLLLSR